MGRTAWLEAPYYDMPLSPSVMLKAQLRSTKCYVALGVARRGRLFLLGSATLTTKLEEVLGPGVDAT